MKEFLQKMIASKRAKFDEMQKRSDESNDLAEVRSIGETLKALADEIKEAEAKLAELDEPAEEQKPEESGERKMNILETVGGEVRGAEVDTEKEFRSAWLRKMQGFALTDAEQRSIAAADVVVPVSTQNKVVTKVKELAPLLNEVELLHIAGSVKFAVEGTVADAAAHAENAAVTPSADKLVTVQLDGYEIVKLVRISATVKTMAIDAFENWLTEQLARKVAEVIEAYIVSGTGTGQPKGIVNAATWGDANSVTFAAAKPTADEIMQLISLLPSRHARAGKFLMNRKTFWANVMPVRDDKKMPIVAGEGAGAYSIFGYPVILSDFVPVGAMYFGNMKMVVANLADDVKVASSEASGFAYNAIDYRGTAIFDCDIADAEAFVKGSNA